MSTKRTIPTWELYERLVAQLTTDQISTDLCVTPNARIKGQISKRSRQIDVLIDFRHDTDNSRRIIIDAKSRNRKLDVKDVEAFRGLMEDVEATHGYLVCTAGYTKSAERRAQTYISIRILPLDRLENFDPSTWPNCQKHNCKHGKIFWDGYPELSVTLQAAQTGALIKKNFLHYVGKCDRCGQFHVKCTECNDLFSLIEGSEADYGPQCSCKRPWFWLASIEQDEKGRKSAELHLSSGLNQIITVDRRSL